MWRGCFTSLKIRANQATIIAGILGVTAGILFARGNLALGILALALSGILDAVDGTIAREFAGATALGGVLDLTLDRRGGCGSAGNHMAASLVAASRRGRASDLVCEYNGLHGYRNRSCCERKVDSLPAWIGRTN
jgi:hypothetical protein